MKIKFTKLKIMVDASIQDNFDLGSMEQLLTFNGLKYSASSW